MSVQVDKMFDNADGARSAVAAISDLPDDVRAFVNAEIERIGRVQPENHKLRVMIAVHDQQTLVHVHTYFTPTQAHS